MGMKDLIDSIRIQIYQRMSSPLFGSFVIAWLCWNHRYLFILFSSEPIQARLQLAHDLVYPSTSSLWFRAAILPLISSVAFILVYPHPSKWLFGYWHKRQIELKKRRDEIESETLLTKAESQKIIRDSIAQREKYEEQIAKLARDIDALKTPGGAVDGDQSTVEQQRERILALEHELARIQATREKQQTDPLADLKEDTQKEILVLLKFAAANRVATADGVAKQMGRSKAKAEFLIDTAMSRGLIQQGNGLQEGAMVLSALGRAYLNDRGLLP